MMTYGDFYDISVFYNERWRAKFTLKEIACNAFEYWCEFEESKEKGKLTEPIRELNKLLMEDRSREALNWLDRIADELLRSFKYNT